jgi:hypothetical protein
VIAADPVEAISGRLKGFAPIGQKLSYEGLEPAGTVDTQ